jgi:phosphohistidine phosphatase
MILYFLRHGLAEERENWGEEDSLRPLTDKGVKQMIQSAEAINDLVPDIDLILTSPYLRARQTAEIVAKRLGLKDIFRDDTRLAPGFDVIQLSMILKEHVGSKALLFVGHEPDFSQVVSDVIGGGQIVVKKGGLVRLDLITLDPPKGWLIWLIPPRALVR